MMTMTVPVPVPVPVAAAAPAAPASSSSAMLANVLRDRPRVDSTHELQQVCGQLQTLLTPMHQPEAKQQIANMSREITSTINRMDDFSALLEAIRSQTTAASTLLIPEFLVRQRALLDVFDKIDRFAEYVESVEACTENLEQRVVEVENAYSEKPAVVNVKKLFTSLMRSTASASSSSSSSATPASSSSSSSSSSASAGTASPSDAVSLDPIEIVNAEDFFVHHTGGSNSNSDNEGGATA